MIAVGGAKCVHMRRKESHRWRVNQVVSGYPSMVANWTIPIAEPEWMLPNFVLS